jgi:GTP cyclohydrolase II
MLSHPPDARDYSIAAQILNDLGIVRVQLQTNNPDKIHQLTHYGINVVNRVPTIPSRYSQSTEIDEPTDLDKYINTKIQRMGHLIDLPERMK